MSVRSKDVIRALRADGIITRYRAGMWSSQLVSLGQVPVVQIQPAFVFFLI